MSDDFQQLVDRVHAAVVEVRAARGEFTGPEQRAEAEAAVLAIRAWESTNDASYQALLDEERRKVAKAEARYACSRCNAGLEPEYTLSDRFNHVRAFMWRCAHRLNCRGETQS